MRRAMGLLAAALLGALLSPACATSGSDDGHTADASVDAPATNDAGRAETGGPDGGTPDAAHPGDSAPAADAGCATGATEACTTSCGTTGAETCAGGSFGACAPPAETCNLVDDDCNGSCDEVLGCRVGVDRSYDATTGLHFYTTTDSESVCCGYALEQHDAFYLYAAAQPGLVPFYRCLTSTGSHLYTTDPACEGETSEGSMGYVASSGVCGAVPLYRLDAPGGDHLYTLSAAEVTSAEGSGYVLHDSPVYVWGGDCGGTGCTWPSPIVMNASTMTAATGFPTAWYGYPIPTGTYDYVSLSGTVSVTNSANIYSEVLFILQYLPTGTCTSGLWPTSTPEYGPPGAVGIGQVIVKSPTQGTVTVPLSFTLPGGLPIQSCVLLGLNGGTVGASHDVTSAANLTVSYGPPATPPQSILGMGGEFCFGQNWGCQRATTDDTQSFANVTPITSATNLVALYGDISDSTFDGTSMFGAPPAGAWTASNDFYVYHGADCASLGVTSGIAGPGDYYASIPATATHLLSVPLSGTGIGVSQQPVFQPFSNISLSAGDCLVTLWGLSGGGGFDNETQVTALVAP